MEKHSDPGPPPSFLDAGVLKEDTADARLSIMLAMQDDALVKRAVEIANFAVYDRQSQNLGYYKRAARAARWGPEVAEKKAAEFRKRVWWFIHHSPLTRAKAREREKANGSAISAGERGGNG